MFPRKSLRLLVKTLALVFFLSGCSHVDMPTISLPKIPEIKLNKNKVGQATPRVLLSARIVNRRYTDQVPKITVGKLIEYAERSFSCSCSQKRFVNAWEKTSPGYTLSSNSPKFSSIKFACQKEDGEYACFINEIENSVSDGLAQQFISGDDFIKTIYSNGRVCARQEVCKE
jgi:hypothetical protein